MDISFKYSKLDSQDLGDRILFDYRIRTFSMWMKQKDWDAYWGKKKNFLFGFKNGN